MYSHRSGSTPATKVIVELPHGLLNQKISVSINLVKNKQKKILSLPIIILRDFQLHNRFLDTAAQIQKYQSDWEKLQSNCNITNKIWFKTLADSEIQLLSSYSNNSTFNESLFKDKLTFFTSNVKSLDCWFLSFSISLRNFDSFTSKPPNSVKI